MIVKGDWVKCVDFNGLCSDDRKGMIGTFYEVKNTGINSIGNPIINISGINYYSAKRFIKLDLIEDEI